jgi:L-2-hydroxyglutarate oxidase LhgO
VGPADIDYSVDPARTAAFYASVRRYWPGLPDGSLVPDYAGVRPKLAAGDAGGVDFRLDGAEVHGLAGHVMCYGLESPALTASLALADEIARRAGIAA